MFIKNLNWLTKRFTEFELKVRDQLLNRFFAKIDIEPNILTLSRAFIAISIIAMNDFISVSVFFILGFLTDIIDGGIARAQNRKTEFGTKFDPIADRILISAIIFFLIKKDIISLWLVSLIGAPEFLLFLAFLYIIKKIGWKSFQAYPTLWGRIKEIFYYLGFVFLLFFPIFKKQILQEIGNILIYLGIIFAMFSFFSYLHMLKNLKESPLYKS